MIRATEFIIFAAGLYTTWRGWVWICDHVLLRERQHVPGLPCDGSPLNAYEQARLNEIELGYGPAPRVAKKVGR